MGKGQRRAPRTAPRSSMLDNGMNERVTVAESDERVCDIPRSEICRMSTNSVMPTVVEFYEAELE